MSIPLLSSRSSWYARVNGRSGRYSRVSSDKSTSSGGGARFLMEIASALSPTRNLSSFESGGRKALGHRKSGVFRRQPPESTQPRPAPVRKQENPFPSPDLG